MTDIARANMLAAAALVDELARAGVREACISPGSRSTPLVLALAKERGIRSWMVTDERCAAFFALGMARVSRRPVAVVCTSGTAAANLSPAVAEAALAEIPLILLTADRPPELRDCGAAQTIRQAGLFANHARWSVDAPGPDSGLDIEPYFRALACRAVCAAWQVPAGPVHLNLPFREPLFDAALAASTAPLARGGRRDGRPWSVAHRCAASAAPEVTERVARLLTRHQHGLIVCGPRTSTSVGPVSVTRLSGILGWPVLADPLSGVRHGDHDRSTVIDAYDVVLRSEAFCAAHRPELVLRFGALPTSKSLQRFLQSAEAEDHVLVASPATWPDPLFVASEVIHADAELFCDGLVRGLSDRDRAPKADGTWLEEWQRSAAIVRQVIDHQFAADTEMFEGRVPSELLKQLPSKALVFVGNSMPVRDFDTFTSSDGRDIEVVANRGANGVDGVLSTALGGAAVSAQPTVLVVGDLSFLHDIGGLQIAARHELRLVVVVVHNDGGGVFSFLPQSVLGETFERYFATPHGLEIEPAVRMCGGSFARSSTWPAFARELERGLMRSGLSVIEVPSDRAHNFRRHQEIITVALDGLRGASESARR